LAKTGVRYSYKTSDLVSAYYLAKDVVLNAGYGSEVDWQGSIRFEDITESDFLREYAWVVLCSGMREEVIRRLFGPISHCFFDWESSKRIVTEADFCFRLALHEFNHNGKISAIIRTAQLIDNMGFDSFKQSIDKNSLATIRTLPYIGPVTCYHLAKNLGLPFAKPDRHLVRLAQAVGYDNVKDFCEAISLETGDPIQVVDIVLWRFATIETAYLKLFSEISPIKRPIRRLKPRSLLDHTRPDAADPKIALALG